jgi:hypothetical protein
VREIVELTNSEDWNHVPGHLNPADLPSRGVSPKKFLELKWWEGPSWLKLEESQWPSGEPEADEEEVNREKRKTTIGVIATSQETPFYIFKASYITSLRVMAFVLRFIQKLRRGRTESDRHPTTEEISKAELRLWKFVQEESFPSDQSVIGGVKVMRDEDGLLRVKTKVVHRQDSNDFKYPVLLPSSHPLVELMIREHHIFNCHAGAQFLVCSLRERCWILQGRRAVKRVIGKCVTCQRFTSKCSELPSAPPPEERVGDGGAFEVTGIDLAGPLVLRDQQKVWIVLFTCGVYRCVHLEIVESLSTEDFLLSFSRFCSRRRRPATVYTDNGTNFIGAENLFEKIDWEEVKKKTRQLRIDWKFNPPAAPWWGGWWERLVRSVKDLLKRMLGFSKVSYVQLETCLCEVESTINHRPLTFVTEDAEDLIPITPAMFIHNLPASEIPETRVVTVEALDGKKKKLEKLLQELRERFRKEYLGILVQKRSKEQTKEFQLGECVLIGRKGVKRILWPMGRIVELMPGRDGINRVARLKVKNGFLVRPLQRLYPLEFSLQGSTPPIPLTKEKRKKFVPIQEEEDDESYSTEAEEIKVTRSGRVVRKPKAWNY